MAAPLRLGLIGAGRWGRNYIRTIAALPDLRLCRLASRNPDSAKLIPPGCRIVPSWRQALDPRSVDGVIIATPPQLHAEMALAAMDAGIPVLIEKPVAMASTQAKALMAKAKERRVYAMVEHTHLFHPAYRALKSLLPRFGPIQDIRCEAGATGPFRPDVPVLWDWGPHDVAMCLDLLQSPATVSLATVQKTSIEAGLGETVRLGLTFPRGVQASIHLSNVVPKVRKLSVRCAHASLVYDGVSRDALVVVSADGRPAPQPVPEAPALTVAVREFASAIRSGSSDLDGLDLAIRVVEVLEACTVAASPAPA